MDCVIVAGGVPQAEDALYAYARGQPKTLIPLAGKPMVHWVVEALAEAQCVERVVVVGLDAGHGLTSPNLVAVLPDHGSMLNNGLAGIEHVLTLDSRTRQILFCNADIPLITGEMIEAFVTCCADPAIDVYYSVVPRALMEHRFPRAGRSYVAFEDGAFAGGDVGIIGSHVLHTHRDLVSRLIKNRKSALKQALKLGVGFFVKLYFQRLSFRELEQAVLHKFALRVRPVPVGHPELGMDIDKPEQLEICRRDLEARGNI